MTKQSFIWALALIVSLNLSGCTDAEPDQSTALCLEAMELNASQLRWNNERKQEVINHACVQGASARTADKLVNGWPMAKIDELLPWAWAQQTKSALRHNHVHQSGGNASETSCASLASA